MPTCWSRINFNSRTRSTSCSTLTSSSRATWGSAWPTTESASTAACTYCARTSCCFPIGWVWSGRCVKKTSTPCLPILIKQAWTTRAPHWTCWAATNSWTTSGAATIRTLIRWSRHIVPNHLCQWLKQSPVYIYILVWSIWINLNDFYFKNKKTDSVNCPISPSGCSLWHCKSSW